MLRSSSFSKTIVSEDAFYAALANFEKRAPVDSADERINQIFGMRHQAKDVFLFGINAGDVVARTIGIGLAAERSRLVAITERDEPFAFELFDGRVVGFVIAFAVSDRDFDHLIFGVMACKSRVVSFDAQMLHLANKAEIGVSHEDAWQQSAFAKDLKPVADAKHQTAARGMSPHGVHDRRAPCYGAAAQIVAVTEAARQDDEIGSRRQFVIVMPQHLRSAANGLRKRARHVAFAIGPRKNDDGGFHGGFKYRCCSFR